MAPILIFGTATFGMDPPSFPDVDSVEKLLPALKELGISRLDTAARYPPLRPGRSEELIGEVAQLSSGFEVDTKVYTDTRTDGSGDLEREKMEESVEKSLKSMKRGGVNVLHAHRADPSTPLEDQIKNFNEQIQKGHAKAWGVSNMSPETLEKILSICDEKGYQKPSSYQGDYSLITRGMETKLLPMLRKHGMTFNGFRPLAAGFLTGKYINNSHAGTRFDASNPLGAAMKNLFGAEALVAALKRYDEGVKAHGLGAAEVALRWLAHHSPLGDADGLVLGASSVEQITQTVGFIRKGKLDGEVVRVAEELWDAVRETRGEII